MTKLKNWLALSTLLISLQVNSSELNIQDAWIRPLTTGQEDAMVGMVINSAKQARVIAVISPAYKFVAIKGPSKNSATNTRELEFIDLPAQKSVVLGAESVHLLLTGNRHTLGASDKVPVIISIQFEDKTSKFITIMAQPVLSKSDAAIPLSGNVVTQASAVIPPATPAKSAEISNKVEAKTVPTPPQSSTAKAMANTAELVGTASASKSPVAEVKPVKSAPAPKPSPVLVAPRVVAVQPPAPVAPPITTVASPAPVAIAVPSAAPLAVEPIKAPEIKPAEKLKQDEERAECLSLAAEIRECDKSNDMMLEWCVTSAKSKYSCKLSLEQLKKL